jgi:trigger factor
LSEKIAVPGGVRDTGGIHLKRIISKAVCLLCAGALALTAAGCSKSAASSSASTSSEASVYGSASDYNYQNFAYSDGLDENGYWSGIRALDYVTLPEDYASIPLKKADIEPTEEDVQSQIDSLLSQNTTTQQITDRAAADGDTVNIDYVGTVDGVAFTGGTYSGYSLTLGSGSFIDGFEDQIVGHKPGETFEVNVTFPDGYSDSTDAEGNAVVLSNKKAVFSVTLNYISEEILPELTDAWVEENFSSTDGVHTVEDLRAEYQKMLYQNNLNTAVMDYLLANSTFKDLPKEVTDYQVNQCLNYYYTMAQYYGYDLDSFLQAAAGYNSADDLLDAMSDSITEYAREALLYQAVAEAMDIAPTQEQIDTYSAYTETYGANYCTMVALMDAVSEALTTGAQVK